MRAIRAGIAVHDSAAHFRDAGIDVFLGEGRFVGSRTVEVAGKRLRFKKAVIATGARAVQPAIPGLSEVGFLTNETVFNLTELPRRLAVIGGGPIGCELAQAFRRLGSEVTILDSGEHFLPREDPDAAEIVRRAFEREGIRIGLGAKVARVERAADGKTIHYEAGGQPLSVTVDAILVGVGRAPNVEGLGLDAAGVAYDRQGVTVTPRLRTTNRHVYACGDVCLPYKFTHVADFTARAVIENALFFGRKRWTDLVIPWATYTDPEVAHVGLYEHEARARGVEVTTFVQPMAGNDRALADGETEGFVKIHVKKGTDRIVGATIVAPHAGEMISEVTMAMVGKVGLGTLSGVIHPYPTQAGALQQAGDAYSGTRLTPGLKAFLVRFFRWRR
jgi:pyruvate/2-oxoglutarate dehydrogenase complex dihydrolipoamide dehydrogenase (E3) component